MTPIKSAGNNWAESQRLNRAEYENPEPEAKAYFDHVAEEFKKFCNASGKVLDIGCGNTRPKYVDIDKCDYIGIDPEESNADFPIFKQ